MHHLVKENNSRFIVLINKEPNTDYLEKLLYEPMKEANIEFYFTDSIIKDYQDNTQKYQIEGDGHPNEIYNEKLANFLHEELNNSGPN